VLHLDEGDILREHTVRVGEDVVLRLPENPTTGFRWTLSAGTDGVLSLESDSYTVSEAKPGNSGFRVFRMRAAAPGIVELRLYRRRRWETTPADPEASFRVRVLRDSPNEEDPSERPQWSGEQAE
jgi:inhibitor of cysteine peptidase